MLIRMYVVHVEYASVHVPMMLLTELNWRMAGRWLMSILHFVQDVVHVQVDVQQVLCNSEDLWILKFIQ